jgi:hypothetical protein
MVSSSGCLPGTIRLARDSWREGRGAGYRADMTPTKPLYAGHRFPPEVIRHAVWLSFRFRLSLRMGEERGWQRRAARRGRAATPP